jgi:transposase
MKVYYGRKLEARRLHQQGLGVAEIAARLTAGRLTVRGWVAAGRVKRAAGKSPSRKS